MPSNKYLHVCCIWNSSIHIQSLKYYIWLTLFMAYNMAKYGLRYFFLAFSGICQLDNSPKDFPARIRSNPHFLLLVFTITITYYYICVLQVTSSLISTKTVRKKCTNKASYYTSCIPQIIIKVQGPVSIFAMQLMKLWRSNFCSTVSESEAISFWNYFLK